MLLLRVASVPTCCFITSRNVLTREDKASRDETKHMRHVRSINFGRQRANFPRIISHENVRNDRSKKNKQKKIEICKRKKVGKRKTRDF